ncbi:hypothetical protein LINPERPRIM_LOCUS24793, partial [Linum perenne]
MSITLAFNNSLTLQSPTQLMESIYSVLAQNATLRS